MRFRGTILIIKLVHFLTVLIYSVGSAGGGSEINGMVNIKNQNSYIISDSSICREDKLNWFDFENSYDGNQFAPITLEYIISF